MASPPNKPKEVLTTGDVARICNVAPRTVSKWFDNGQLRGYRIPGSKDRRIPLHQLIRFMRAHGIPLGELETGQTRILIVDDDNELTGLLQRAMTDGTDYEVRIAASAFEAGAIAEQFHPSVIMVDVDLPGIEGRRIARYLATHDQLQDTQLLAVGASISEADRQAFLQEGFSGILTKPYNLQQLAQAIEDSLSVRS